MASTSSYKSPSGFASLLRGSKFASYDPKIGQVYTSPQAHRARGNWGLKYNIGGGKGGKKFKYLTFEQADTPWRVPFWKSAERSARWTLAMDQIAPAVEARGAGTDTGRVGWAQRVEEARPQDLKTWYDESEFAAGVRDWAEGSPSNLGSERLMRARPSTNWHRLSPEAFERFLRGTRGLREEFKDWVLERRREAEVARAERAEERERKRREWVAAHPGRDLGQEEKEQESIYGQGEEVNMFALAHSPTVDVLLYEFLRERVQPNWKTQLIPAPHPNGAINYAQPSKLQTFLDTKPVDGVALGQNRWAEPHQGYTPRLRQSIKEKEFLIGFGGHIALFNPKNGKGTTLARVADDELMGRGKYRVWDAVMHHPPQVTATRDSRPPEDAGTARVQINLQDASDEESSRRYTPRPGSPGWITLDQQDKKQIMFESGMARETTTKKYNATTLLDRGRSASGGYGGPKQDSGRLIGLLSNLLDKQGVPENVNRYAGYRIMQGQGEGSEQGEPSDSRGEKDAQ